MQEPVLQVWDFFSALQKEEKEIAARVRIMGVFFCDDDDGLIREISDPDMMPRVLQVVQRLQ